MSQTTGGGAPQAAGAVALEALTINRQRIPSTVDFLGQQDTTVEAALQPFRVNAATKVYLGLQQVQTSLQAITNALGSTPVPAQLVGLLQNPDSSAAALVQVTFDPTVLGGKPPARTVLTNDAGGFTLFMPAGALMPGGGIPLQVHGANGNATVTITPAQTAANGLVGVITLPTALAPLPVSILAALQALLPTTLPDPGAPQPATAPQLPAVKLGEGGPCSQEFNAQPSLDRFPFGVFVRLVEPRLSIVSEVTHWPVGEAGGNAFIPLPVYLTGAGTTTVTSYADRVPVEQPISVDGFRDQIMGLEPNGIFGADETVPMAASLGLGYVLEMSQQWTFTGVGLGDLVYSLPLAPGEQQQVAVFERQDTSVVTESEFFSESEAAQQTALADTSTAATFNSAFNEAVNSGSTSQSSSSNYSAGGGLLGLFSAGGGGASSSSTVNSWLQGQRDIAQNAAEQTHSAAASQSAARRSAARTGMRMASASESESVTTKTITNHNHMHALTVQYWEVLRNYSVTTVIDGLTMACLVPMQIVRFMPPGQPLTIADPSVQFKNGRSDVLARYNGLVKHLDVLQQSVPRQYQNGLTLLSQFAADPTAQFEAAGGVAEDVIAFTLTGSFVPCETISVRAVTRRNTRVGPVVLANTATAIPLAAFTSKDALLASLLQQRQASWTPISGNLALPPSLNRADVVGFEIMRTFNPLSYTLISQAQAAANGIAGLFPGLFGGGGGASTTSPLDGIYAAEAVSVPTTVTLSPGDLESALGGPMLINFGASIVEYSATGAKLPPAGAETYANESLGFVQLPPQPYAVPALQIAPVLRYSEILEIERTMHHVVRNITLYSRAVWASLTPDERAIMLDVYTIGVPSGGVSDPSQMVPLLNCVENRLLGFFGNSMVLPFIIPQSVAEEMQLDTAAIQRVLLAYQQASFQPPAATFTLPTRGVLGEAVLGHCPSAEKIDLTRFWNWQDSPADTAPAISPVTLPTTTPSLTAGLTAPNSLGNLPNLVNNVLTAPQPNTGLLSQLASGAISQKDFDTAMAGVQQLATLAQGTTTAASSASANALNSYTQLQSQLISTVGSIMGGGGSGGGSGGKGSGSGGSGSGSSGGGSSSGGSSGASAVSALIPIIAALL